MLAEAWTFLALLQTLAVAANLDDPQSTASRRFPLPPPATFDIQTLKPPVPNHPETGLPLAYIQEEVLHRLSRDAIADFLLRIPPAKDLIEALDTSDSATDSKTLSRTSTGDTGSSAIAAGSRTSSVGTSDSLGKLLQKTSGSSNDLRTLAESQAGKTPETCTALGNSFTTAFYDCLVPVVTELQLESILPQPKPCHRQDLAEAFQSLDPFNNAKPIGHDNGLLDLSLSDLDLMKDLYSDVSILGSGAVGLVWSSTLNYPRVVPWMSRKSLLVKAGYKIVTKAQPLWPRHGDISQTMSELEAFAKTLPLTLQTRSNYIIRPFGMYFVTVPVNKFQVPYVFMELERVPYSFDSFLDSQERPTIPDGMWIEWIIGEYLLFHVTKLNIFDRHTGNFAINMHRKVVRDHRIGSSTFRVTGVPRIRRLDLGALLDCSATPLPAACQEWEWRSGPSPPRDTSDHSALPILPPFRRDHFLRGWSRVRRHSMAPAQINRYLRTAFRVEDCPVTARDAAPPYFGASPWYELMCRYCLLRKNCSVQTFGALADLLVGDETLETILRHWYPAFATSEGAPPGSKTSTYQLFETGVQ